MNPPAPEFYPMLDRLRAEGPDRWELECEPTPNAEDLKTVTFTNKAHQKAVILDGDPGVTIPTRGRQ